MTNYHQKRKKKEKWVSPTFYTDKKGYKIRLRVYASDRESGEGTHLSTYITLMKGEFDDQLKWPFAGSLKVELLSHDNGKGNLTTIISINEAGDRVTEGEESEFMHGKDDFISQYSLQQEYLKNDCLKFRVILD